MSMPHNVVCSFNQRSLFETRIEFDILDSVSTIRNNSRIVNYFEVPITTQDHVPSHHKKNPNVLDMGLSPFLAFKVCHLVSKSLYCPTANLKVMEEPNF